jgi:hypothetical protein
MREQLKVYNPIGILSTDDEWATMAREPGSMRHKPRKIRKVSRATLFGALTIVSHVAAIAGTIVMILDTLHHW